MSGGGRPTLWLAWLGRAWDAIRPRTPRGAILFVLAVGAFSLALFVGARVAPSVVEQYGYRPAANAAIWRSLEPSYGEVAVCATCHAPQYAKLTSATHAGIGCESCHGPLGRHALASPGTVDAEVTAGVPTDTVCVRCHTTISGRPAELRQIVPADHYTTACLACHDPHTGISQRPPIVEHPLDNLPTCVTCHGPEGFKARNQRHPVVDSADTTCLACHLPGRGPEPIQGVPSDDRTGVK